MSFNETANPELAAAANHLRIIGHPSRLAIALLLLNGPCPVSVIETTLGLHQPNLSQHLGLLRDANILTSRRQARSVVYDFGSGPLRELVSAIAKSLALPAALPREELPAREDTPPRTRADESDDASVFAHVFPAEDRTA